MKHLGTRMLGSERIVLRRIEVEDYKQMYENWACKEECSKYFPWSAVTDIEVYKKRVLTWVDNYKDDLYFNWLIVRKDTKEAIGIINLHNVDEQSGAAETSYILAPDHWGNGLMTEAVRRVLQYAFEELELSRVCADVFAGNVASEKVLEKCGFQCEGVIKERYEKDGIRIDAILYGIHKS